MYLYGARRAHCGVGDFFLKSSQAIFCQIRYSSSVKGGILKNFTKNRKILLFLHKILKFLFKNILIFHSKELQNIYFVKTLRDGVDFIWILPIVGWPTEVRIPAGSSTFFPSSKNVLRFLFCSEFRGGGGAE